MIRVVTPDIPVGWLLEDEQLSPDTEFLVADDAHICGWCTVDDALTGSGAGISTVGEMRLQPCEIRDEAGLRVIRCGRFALLVEAYATRSPFSHAEGEPAMGWPRLLRGRWGTVLERSGSESLGPLPDPQPVKVARSCRNPVCGFRVYVPPSPSPCPNRRVPPHAFV